MKKKLTALLFLALFVGSFMIGVAASQVEAKPPRPCRVWCDGVDTYICCVVSVNPLVEECFWDHAGCP